MTQVQGKIISIFSALNWTVMQRNGGEVNSAWCWNFNRSFIYIIHISAARLISPIQCSTPGNSTCSHNVIFVCRLAADVINDLTYCIELLAPRFRDYFLLFACMSSICRVSELRIVTRNKIETSDQKKCCE